MFQTCMTFFLLLNKKVDVLKNVGNRAVAFDFHRMEENTEIFLKISYFICTEYVVHEDE